MMWWSYDVVASQCSQSYICGLWSLSLIIITFIFICCSLWSSVLSLLFSVVSGSCGVVVLLITGVGLMVWWWVLLITGLNNRCWF